MPAAEAVRRPCRMRSSVMPINRLPRCICFRMRVQCSKKRGMSGSAAAPLNRLLAIHINDSKKDLGSHVDRHTHIGKGYIGTDAFKLILNDPRLAHVPKLLETAKKEGDIDWDQRNLTLLRSLVASKSNQP